MKIAICGKGGCGKSTVTALLAKELEARGREVLVIDSDESNYGLHRQLGMELPCDFTELFGGKKKILPRMLMTMQHYKFVKSAWKISDIPAEYTSRRGKITLISSGKIHEANEGCACAMGNVMQQFIENLQLGANQVALLDMEAGIEHFGRGVDNGVDRVVMIVDPTYESICLSKKIAKLASEIGKPLGLVLNKVSAGDESVIREAVSANAEILAVMPLDAELQKAGLTGAELKPGSVAVSALANALLK